MSTRIAMENEESPKGSKKTIISSVLTVLSLNWYIITHKIMLVCLEGDSGVERSICELPAQKWGDLPTSE